MDNRLQKTLDKLDSLIKQKRGSIGNPRLVDILNDLTTLTSRITNGEGKRSVSTLKRHVGMLIDALDKEKEGKTDSDDE